MCVCLEDSTLSFAPECNQRLDGTFQGTTGQGSACCCTSTPLDLHLGKEKKAYLLPEADDSEFGRSWRALFYFLFLFFFF